MLIPISFSGWGCVKARRRRCFRIAGATAAQGFATSVAFGLAFIVAVLPGLIPLLLGSRAEGAET